MLKCYISTFFTLKQDRTTRLGVYLWYDCLLKVNAENHWLHSEDSSHAIFGNPKVIEIPNKRHPPILDATSHELRFER